MTYSSPLTQPCRTGQHQNCHMPTCACGCHTEGPEVLIPDGARPGGRPGNLQRHQLVDRLNRSAEELDQLMAFLVTLAESQNIDPMRMQYPNGEPAMAPLVCAQAQVLAGLAFLQAAP